MSDVHVLPDKDLIQHLIEDCPCGPRAKPAPRDDGSMGWVLYHYPLDGREIPYDS